MRTMLGSCKYTRMYQMGKGRVQQGCKELDWKIMPRFRHAGSYLRLEEKGPGLPSVRAVLHWYSCIRFDGVIPCLPGIKGSSLTKHLSPWSIWCICTVSLISLSSSGESAECLNWEKKVKTGPLKGNGTTVEQARWTNIRKGKMGWEITVGDLGARILHYFTPVSVSMYGREVECEINSNLKNKKWVTIFHWD